jgi:pimeloyl-ACP methyl ester carboxylesterase
MARALWKMVHIADEHGISAFGTSAAHGASTTPAHGTVVSGSTAAAAPGVRRDVVLIGHSLGCELALHAAAECIRASDRGVPADAPKIAGIVLVNPVGLRPHKALRPFAVARFLGRAMDWPAPFGGLMKGLVYQFWIRVFGFSPRTRADEVEWGQRRVAARDFVKLAEDVALVRARGVPSGVLYARDDHLVEPAVPEELAEALGSRHVVLCESGGHYLNKWQGNEIASLVAQLLAEGQGRADSGGSQSNSPTASIAASGSAVSV